MADVTFNDDTEIAPRRTVPNRKESLFTRIMISWGLAKDPAGAQVILFVMAILFFVVAVLVQVWLSETYATPKPIPTTLTKTAK